MRQSVCVQCRCIDDLREITITSVNYTVPAVSDPGNGLYKILLVGQREGWNVGGHVEKEYLIWRTQFCVWYGFSCSFFFFDICFTELHWFSMGFLLVASILPLSLFCEMSCSIYWICCMLLLCCRACSQLTLCSINYEERLSWVVLVTKMQKHVVGMGVLCGSGICQELCGLGGIKVFWCTILLHSCFGVHPCEIQSHGSISEWKCCTLWAPAALTPATCETKDEINVQGNISPVSHVCSNWKSHNIQQHNWNPSL